MIPIPIAKEKAALGKNEAGAAHRTNDSSKDLLDVNRWRPRPEHAEFNFAQVDEDLGFCDPAEIEAPPSQHSAAELLEVILRGVPSQSPKPLRAAALAFAALVYLGRLEVFSSYTLRSAASELGITPEGFRKYVSFWEGNLGLRGLFHKSQRARESYRAAQLAAHRRRRATAEASQQMKEAA